MLSKVLTGEMTFVSKKPPNLSCCTKKQLQEYFENSYSLNESIFTALRDETVMYKCPDRLRLPLVFYYCHTAVVYVNKLMLAGLLKDRVNLEFETMFETGVDEMSWDDTENYRMGGSYKWPSLDATVNYRRTVKNLVLKMIQDTPLELPITMESPWWAFMMGVEHERIHVETSSVLIRQLPVEMLIKPDDWNYAPHKHGEKVGKNDFVKVADTDVIVGKPKDFASYGWDNEYGTVKQSVPEFEATKYLITNGEFLEFVNAGGYNNRTYWTDEAWDWKMFRQSKHPVFWICNEGCKSGCGSELANYSHCHFPADDIKAGNQTNGSTNGTGAQTNGNRNGHIKTEDKYMYRAMFDVIPLPLDWPVDVNYHEAKAYCTWKGEDYRLPTEAEYAAMKGFMPPASVGVKSDVIFQDVLEANLNIQYGSSCPVNMFPPSSNGFYDLSGNIWQWTEDNFNGLKDFTTHFLYDDFSSPCFDGRHNIILGGSWISTGDEASRFARFAFRRHFIQHAGFRMARSTKNKNTLPAVHVNSEVFVLGVGCQENQKTEEADCIDQASTNCQYMYDTDMALQGILEQEFGFRESLPAVVAKFCVSLPKTYHADTKTAMWFGAGTGRGPFEISDVFQNVLGVDFGGRFLDTAMKIQQGNEIEFKQSNGETGLANTNGNTNINRIVFKQLTWIPNEITESDMTIVTFLDRVMNPKAWLVRLGEITTQTGVVVIASTDGKWTKDTLMPCFGDRLQFRDAVELAYDSSAGQNTAMVTVWTRI